MTHEVKISFFNKKTGKWEVVCQTFTNEKEDKNAGKDGSGFIPVNYKPYIAVTLSINATLITGATINWANPPENVAKNSFSRLVKINLYYGNIKGDYFQLSTGAEFVGLVTQPPYYVDGASQSDKILVMPLSMGAVFENKSAKIQDTMKIGDVMPMIFNIENMPKTIEYYPETIKDQYLKKDIIFNPNNMNLTQIIDYFAKVEDLVIKITPSCCVKIMNRDYIKENLTNGDEKNTAIIYNTSREIGYKFGEDGKVTGSNYVNTFIKTRFAVMNLAGGLDLELAFFLPHLVGKEFCKIPNIGENINIYSSTENSQDTKKEKGDMTFYIQRQEIVFSTWGENTHVISLQNINSYQSQSQEGSDEASQ